MKMNALGKLLRCILMSTILGVSHAQTPLAKKCVDQYELTFFNDNRKNYAGAKATCESLGGYLAKVDNQRMTYVINATFELVGSINSYFIGGNDKATEGDWKWQDGTDMIMRGEVGYQNWKYNQPNNDASGEDCLLIGRDTYQWVDTTCHELLFYICQSEHSTPEIGSDDDPSHHEKICRVKNCVNTTAEWYKESSHEQVTTDFKKNGIYQKIDGSSSTLHFDNATILDIGKYYCRAHNSSKEFFDFKVDGNPTITSITNSSCSRSLFVTWNPSRYAVGFRHKITANNYITKEESFSTFIIPKSNTSVIREISGLKTTTEYNVTIKVCVSDDECRSTYSATTTAKTDGKTQPVTSASLSTNCSIQWIWKNNNQPVNVAGLKVTRYCTTIATRSNVNSPHMDSFNISMPRTYTPVPNRNCTVSIQVIGCAGLSEAVNAKGYCVGKPAAPDAIAKPIASFDATDSNGIRKITVTKPDDSNGLLSCLFIIVHDESSGENTHFKMENLIKAQSSTTEYIAVALPVYRFTGDRQVVNLGDNSGSSCNVTQTIDVLSKKRRRRRNVGEHAIFVGQNRKLNREKSYSVFVVSTTPCENEICLRTSPSILLKKKSFEFNIISFVIGFLIPLIFYVVFALIIYKLMKKNKKLKKIAEAKEHNYETIQEKATFSNDPVSQPSYSNVLQETAGYEQALPATTKQTQVESAYETYNT
ncbi:uncharacterized protein LOC120334849 [Styela clava]